MTTDDPVYWEPFEARFAIDPYPAYARLREEAPLYYNEKHDFYAVSRFDDCDLGLSDWRTFSSSRGSILELVQSGIEMPPGTVIFEDPPTHNIHRGLLVRVFTPGLSAPWNRRSASIAPAPWTHLSARTAST
jgi:cytochrome P450